MRRGFVDGPRGQLHYAEEGAGEVVLLLHQSARSWRSFARLSGYLAERYRAVAMDYPGFGESESLSHPIVMSDLVGVVIDLLDGLGIDKVRIYGHHTGAAVGAELGVAHPDRVEALALSGYPYIIDEEERAQYMDLSEQTIGQPRRLPVMKLEQDGSHLVRLWQRAALRLWQSKGSVPFESVSEEDIEFVTDWVMDAIKARFDAPATFQAVFGYDSNAQLPKLKTPTLLVESSGPYERDLCARADLVQKLIPGSKLYTVENGDIYASHWRADEISRVLMGFFSDPSGFAEERSPAASPA